MKFQQEYEVAKATTGGGGKTLDISKKNKGKVTSNNNLHSPEKRMKRSKLVQQANQRIGRCMNLIRFVTEHEYFVGKNVAIIEQCVKPLLQFADRPEEIDFEDDLIFCIDALIKKSRSCSPMMQELFPYLQKFQMKYNGVLANLTCCLNSYIIFGKDFIESDERNVQLLLEMVWRAISLNPAGDHNFNDESNADFAR